MLSARRWRARLPVTASFLLADSAAAISQKPVNRGKTGDLDSHVIGSDADPLKGPPRTNSLVPQNQAHQLLWEDPAPGRSRDR